VLVAGDPGNSKYFVKYFVTSSVAYGLLYLNQMIKELRCDHCEQRVTSNAFRVISDDPEGGGILLDMIVCHACSEKAQELGLKIEEIDWNDRYLKRG